MGWLGQAQAAQMEGHTGLIHEGELEDFELTGGNGTEELPC